jgi:hypothetical protein
MHDPQGAHCFNNKKIELICVRAAPGPGDRFQPIDRIFLSIFFDKRLVPRVLDLMRDFIERLIPRNVLPIRSARPPHLRLQQPAIIEDVLLERRSLRTQCAAVGRVVGVAFDVHYLRRNVLRLVSDGIDDRAATHRTIRTRRPRLTGSGDFEDSELRVSGLEIEPKYSGSRAANGSELQKVSAGSLHRTPLG